MGFGILFKVDDDSMIRHENDRKIRFEGDLANQQEGVIEMKEEDQSASDQYFITSNETGTRH